MTLIYPDTDHQFYINKTTVSNLDIYKDAVLNNNFDFVGVVDGVVGSGKSTLTFQLARYFDETFCLDDVYFTPEDFIKALQTYPKHKAIVLDEAIEGTLAQEHANFLNRKLAKLLTKVRHRGYFIFLVLPSYFEMKKGLAIYRTNMLVHCYLDKMKRGQYLFFSYPSKKNLYVNGKKMLNYQSSPADFLADFSKYIPFDYDAYDERKRNSYSLDDEPKIYKKEQKLIIERAKLIEMLMDVGLTQGQIAWKLQQDSRSISKKLNYRIRPPKTDFSDPKEKQILV